MELSPVGVVVKSVADSRIVYHNALFKKLFEIHHERIIGHKVYRSKQSRNYINQIIELDNLCISTGEPVSGNLKFPTSTGDMRIYFSNRILLTDCKGREGPLIVSFYLDLTDQESTKLKLANALKADMLKSDFLSNMSHEIRTPLNAISGFAELIAGEDLTEEERREFAQIIRDNTQLFTSLINDMLEVSQLDNTSAEMPRKLLDISKIIRAEMEHLPVKEGVEYRLKLAAPEIVFPLHRSYVSLLVRELLKNAVKFTEQGSVTVKCGLTGSDTLTLSVTDTGCGVEPGLAEKIFDRFYKGDPFAQGLGLGLSLCRLIVEKLGGTIALDTSYTGGARFVVTLRDA